MTQQLSPAGFANDASNRAATPTFNAYTYDNLLLTSTVPVSSDGSTRRRTTYGYDSGGRRTSTSTDVVNSSGAVLTSGGQQTLAHFNDDRLSDETGRTGATNSYGYDPAGNRTSWIDRQSTPNVSVSASYYLDGLLRTADDAHATSDYSYDAAGNPSVLTSSLNGTTSWYATLYAYDEAGLPASMSWTATGGSTAWTYDHVGRPTQEADANGQKVTRSYNPGRYLAQQALNGAAARWSYTYDANLRITDQQFIGVGAADTATPVVGDFKYSYDAANRLASFTNGATTQTATYDHDGNRLSYGNTTQPSTPTTPWPRSTRGRVRRASRTRPSAASAPTAAGITRMTAWIGSPAALRRDARRPA